MARMKRLIVPGYPHHVVQRGVRSLDIFFEHDDRVEYLHLLRKQGDRFGVKFISYCLMTSHVHLLAVPLSENSLAKAIGEAHRLYTRMINFRENTKGYLFQGRFSSCPVATDRYLVTVLQYILRNPVKAKMVTDAIDYEWSSAAWHCGMVSHDPLVQKDELLALVDNWEELLVMDSELSLLLEEKNRTGRPFGSEEFFEKIEEITGIDARPGHPGRPKKQRQK